MLRKSFGDVVRGIHSFHEDECGNDVIGNVMLVAVSAMILMAVLSVVGGGENAGGGWLGTVKKLGDGLLSGTAGKLPSIFKGLGG